MIKYLSEQEAFEEWADEEWCELNVRFNDNILYCKDDEIFYVSDISFVPGGYESEWEYKKHILDNEDLVQIILDNL